MKHLTTCQLVKLSLYAALVFISAQFLHIPLGVQFVHFGNTLAVIAVLLYGSRLSALVAAIGLSSFNVLNGYVAEVWIIILEFLIVCLVSRLVFEKLMHSDDKTRDVIIAGIAVAITKVISSLAKYTITNSIVGGLQFQVTFLAALVKIGGTFGSAPVMIISVPIPYPILKQTFLHHIQPKTISE